MQNFEAFLTLVIYSALLVGIGFWASRRAGSEDEFLLGDRNLGSVVAGLAYAASTSSAWVLIGFSGFVYEVGLSALWMVPGILAGYAVVWFWAGRLLQTSSREHDQLTLTDFLVQGLPPGIAKYVRILASVMIAYCFTWYIAAQLQGAGQAFDDLFGSGPATGVIIGAILILAYTFFGGFVAVSIVDMLQGLLIALVALVLPLMALLSAGGPVELLASLHAAPDGYADLFGGRSGFIAAGFVLGLSATGFGALGQPHLLSWVMATRNASARLAGGAIAIGWGGLVYMGMALLGLSARIVFGAGIDGESVFFGAAAEFMPGVLAGIVAAAALSAIMSTVDSQLLVAGAALGRDTGLSTFLPGHDILKLRVAVLAVCVCAVAVTVLLPSTVFERVLFAWVALGAAFGPVVVIRTLGWTPSGPGVLLAILAGFLSCLVFTFTVSSGPGSLWSTTIPWLAAFSVLTADQFLTGTAASGENKAQAAKSSS